MTVEASIPFSATPIRTFEVISLYGNWSDVVNDLLKRLSLTVSVVWTDRFVSLLVSGITPYRLGFGTGDLTTFQRMSGAA